MVIEGASRGGAPYSSPDTLELLPAPICEGFIDAFTRHFSEPLWTCVSACKADLFLGQCCSVPFFFHWCVISLFCLCLQGWPMNRQLRKGPRIFHRSDSESKAPLPGAGAAPSPGPPPSWWSWAGPCTLLQEPAYQLSPGGLRCLFFLQYSVKRHYFTVFGTIASSLSSFIFGLVSVFLSFFMFAFNEPEKPKMMYSEHKEQY